MSKTIVVDIRNSAFPGVIVRPGSYVVWRNLDPFPHSAETERKSDPYFNAGPMLPGEMSAPVLFTTAGQFDYRCRYHTGMSGKITVDPQAPAAGAITQPGQQNDGSGDHSGHDGGHIHAYNHLHGFVTGGRSGKHFYMAHTPVLADPRHCYQVILQGSLRQDEHAQIYANLRSSEYGHRRVQIFHSHTSLPGIAVGEIKELPHSSFAYYPDDRHPDDQEDIAGLTDVPVTIDKVIHFHRFEVDSEDSDGPLEYLIYGDEQDIFIDHLMNRAPSFHSVAKLASAPPFWPALMAQQPVRVQVPAKRIQYMQPKVVQRIAFVDNSFHIFWLPPTGVYGPTIIDPLFPRKDYQAVTPSIFSGGPYRHDVVLPDGSASFIELAPHSLHMDLRLLNYGVFLPDNA